MMFTHWHSVPIKKWLITGNSDEAIKIWDLETDV